jgi:hypothetical protein
MKTLTLDKLVVGSEDGQQIWITADEILALDKNRTVRAHLKICRSGSPSLELCDGNGNGRITLSVEDNGCPYITLQDGNHTRRLEMTLGEDEGDAELSIFDRSDQRVFILSTDHTDQVTLRVPGEDGLIPWVPTKAV